LRLEEEKASLQASLEAAEREKGTALQALEAAHQDKQVEASAPVDESPRMRAWEGTAQFCIPTCYQSRRCPRDMKPFICFGSEIACHIQNLQVAWLRSFPKRLNTPKFGYFQVACWEEEKASLQATHEAAERERAATVQTLETANRDKQAEASAPPDENPMMGA
jgi:hypothetical protein